MRAGPVVAAALMVLVGLSGCLDAYREFEDFDPTEHYHNVGVFAGDYLAGNAGSMPLERGTLETPLYPDVYILESDRPAYGEASGLMGPEGRVDIVMAIWHPDNYTEKRPIIVDAGPYYEQGGDRIEDAGQSTPRLVQNMLPLGYSVVQLAVRGTGTAGGCMDLLGPDEGHDLDQAITWLGQQNWSNGNIGMIGVSYDGSTPWVVAGMGNPYLKTIVPISGLPSLYDLMFRNGSAETRGPVMHGKEGYWNYGFSPEFPQQPAMWPVEGLWAPPLLGGTANNRAEYQDRQNLFCPAAIEGQAMGRHASADMGQGEAFSDYWTERDHRQRVLDNYDGSVFLIHGLQDWNVDPHNAIPFNKALVEAGIPVKQWYGQWDHAWPDSGCVPGTPQWALSACRLDFGDVLARWFDRYLMENETDTGPAIQVQDNLGFWRNADTYPPADAVNTRLRLGANGALGANATAGEMVLPAPNPAQAIDLLHVVSEPFPDGVHISGIPKLTIPFSVEGAGGHVAAWLFDLDPNGHARAPYAVQSLRPDGSNLTFWEPFGLPVVGHAQMNLRFHEGGDEPTVLQPGQRYEARIAFEPLEVHIPEGHQLGLWVFQYHYPDRTDSTVPGSVTLHLDDSAVLALSDIDLDPRTVFPVPSVPFQNETYVPEMYIPIPVIEGVDASDGLAPDATPVAPKAKLPKAACVETLIPCGAP